MTNISFSRVKKKLKSNDETKYITFYFSPKDIMIINESDIDDAFQ